MYKDRSPQISLNAIFFGSEQSKYAGVALFGTIFILCLAILFSNSKIPIDQRLAFVIFIMLVAIPSILMSLFELTCIVTGGNIKYRWWCWLLAWVIAVVIILYCLMVVISLIMSMANFDIANQRVENNEENNKIDTKTADEYAKNVIKQYEDENEKNMVKKEYYNESEDEINNPIPSDNIELPIQDEQFSNKMHHNNKKQHTFSMPNQYSKQVEITGIDSGDVFAPI
jgi:TfoX/Sxy family transcriptional regulator of competence genes